MSKVTQCGVNGGGRPGARRAGLLGRDALKKLSIFYRYLISYTGLTILACTLVGVVLLNHYARMLSAEATQVNRNKLMQIATDLETQSKTMKDAALEIAVSTYYKPYYIHAKKTNEISLLDQFAKYAVISPIVGNYCLYYIGDDRLYKQDAKNSVDVYFRDVLKARDPGGVIKRALSAEEDEVIPFVSGGEPALIFVYPVSTLSAKGDDGQAVLCFVVSKATLEARARTIAGELPGRLSLYFGNSEPVMTLFDGKYEADAGQALIEHSSGGQVAVSFVQDAHYGLDASLDSFRELGLAIIFGLLAVLLGLGALLAYGNYRPIKRLGDMGRSIPEAPAGAQGRNEIERIGSMLQYLADCDSQNKRMLRYQLTLLTRQIVNTLLNDGYSDEIGRMLRSVGMALNGGVYCVFSVKAKEDGMGEAANRRERFLAMTEARHGDSFALYPGVQQPNGTYPVLAVLTAPSRFEDVCEAALAAGEDCFNHAFVGMSGVYDDLSHTTAAYLESQTALHIAIGAGESRCCFFDASARNTLSGYSDDQLMHLLKALRLGHEEDALMHLNVIVRQMKEYPHAVITDRHFCSSILCEMTKTLQSLNLPMDGKGILSAIAMNSLDEFEQRAAGLITNACLALNKRKNSACRELADDVLEYIQSHCCEYSLGLKSLEDRFGLAAQDLSALVRSAVGESFKSHLIRLRMERAKILLLYEDMPVHHVSATVGYGSVSHFIRVFTAFAGCTPAQYKEGGDSPMGAVAGADAHG